MLRTAEVGVVDWDPCVKVGPQHIAACPYAVPSAQVMFAVQSGFGQMEESPSHWVRSKTAAAVELAVADRNCCCPDSFAALAAD